MEESGNNCGKQKQVGFAPGHRSMDRNHHQVVQQNYNHQIQQQHIHNPNHHHQTNPVISNHQLTQSHPHLYLNNSSNPQPQAKAAKSNLPNHKEGYSGPISASYQHLPSYFIQQEHLNPHHYQSSSNITQSSHQINHVCSIKQLYNLPL